MALQSVRREYRVVLHHVDRGLERSETVLVAQHPSESNSRVTLRVLAWCLLNDERLAFGPGLSTPDTADLWAHDLTGQLTTWIECGTADADALKRVLQHNTGVAVHAVFNDRRRHDELVAAVAAWKRPPTALTTWLLDAALVEALAARPERRQKWTVTVVGDHLYIDADGVALDGSLDRGLTAD